MKKTRKKDGARRVGRTVLGFVLSAALAVTMMPAMAIMDGPAFAADKGMKEMKKLNTFNYVKDSALEHQDSFAYKKGSKEQKALKKAAASYPASFDLRNVNGRSYVTPVRVQNPFGTCWGFAAVAAAESSLLASGLAAKCGLDANTLHLSEKQISYFVNTYIDDPNDSQYGEGTHFRNITKEDEANSAYKYNTGGMTFMATSMFGSGIGPAQVWDDNDPFAYGGKNKERTFWNVATRYLADGTADPNSYQRKPVWYSAQDDWSIPSKYRFWQDFRLKNSIVLPDPANYDTGSYAFNPDSIAAIKQQMYENNRAVCISFCAESYLPGQDTSGKKYMSENWAHFTNNPNEFSNHVVTVVGWDDNYPKENFASTTEYGYPAQPEGDGAFLIKNSWGSELNEFPYNAYRHWGLLQGKDGVPYDKNAKAQSDRATGYFWISYYDRSVNDPEAFEFDEVLDHSLYCEQTDFMFPMYLLYNYTDGIRMANVFRTEATSELNEISAMTTTPGTTVSYQVYMLGESFTGPEDGILIASGTESYDTGGYHRIALKTPKVLTKGQLYSVVVKENYAPWGDYVPYSAAYNKEGNDSYSVGVINEGESYLYTGGKWLDMSQKSTQRKLTANYPNYDLTLDNFPVKSYLTSIADPADPGKDFAGYLNIYNWALGSPGTFTLNTGEDMTLDAEFLGITGDMPASWNPAISWKSENPAVFTVTPEPQDNGQAKITGLAAGKADLVVDAGAYGTRVLSIIVEKPNTKASNTLNVWGKTAKVKYSKLAKKSQKLAVTRVIDFYDKGEGTLTYKKVEGSGKITINKKTGQVTIKKGLKKGTYEVKIRVSAAGNKKYNPGSRVIMSTIIVK